MSCAASPRSEAAAAVLIERGDAHSEAGEYEAAVAAYLEAETLTPWDAEPSTSAGFLLLDELLRPLQAAASFHRAVAADPDDEDLRIYRRNALKLCGCRCAAASCINRVLSNSTTIPVDPLCGPLACCSSADCANTTNAEVWMEKGRAAVPSAASSFRHFSFASLLAPDDSRQVKVCPWQPYACARRLLPVCLPLSNSGGR